MAKGYPYKRRLQPLLAADAMIRLLIDKEDTKQAFRILRALEGRETQVQWDLFQASPVGQAVLREKRELGDFLRDRNHLRKMPSGSLGRAYVDFMETDGVDMGDFDDISAEAQDTGDGLSPEEQLFRRRCRNLHDIWHILAGLGRDRIGEIALFAFTYSQFGDRGIRFIVWAGGLDARRRWRHAGIKETIEEGFRLGRECVWLAGVDWENLMDLPLEQVRRLTGVRPARCYRRTVEVLRAIGAEGYDTDPLAGLPPSQAGAKGEVVLRPVEAA